MSNLSVFTFAVNRAEIAPWNNGAAVGSWIQIPVTAESSAEYTMQNVEITDGEGNLLMNFYHTQRVRVQLRTKRFSFRILEVLSGSPVSSQSGKDQMYFGRTEELTPPFTRLRLQQKAVDASGNAGYFETIILKAQGKLPPITMREVTAGEFTLEFNGLQDTTDENGATIPTAMISIRALKPTTA